MKKIKKYFIKRNIKNIFNSYELYFISFTFSDEYLSSSSYKKRFVMIKDFLDRRCNKYIAGQCFNKNEREYYACLCDTKINYKDYPFTAVGHKVPRQSPEAYMKYFENTDYVIYK